MARAELLERLRREARDVYEWSNGPGDRYGWHSHTYTKILYCLDGSIEFIVAPADVHEGAATERIRLMAGDRMELPARTSHSAVVGDRGVICAEGKKG